MRLTVGVGGLLESLFKVGKRFLELPQFGQRKAEQAVEPGQAGLEFLGGSDFMDRQFIFALLEIDGGESGVDFGDVGVEFGQLLEVFAEPPDSVRLARAFWPASAHTAACSSLIRLRPCERGRSAKHQGDQEIKTHRASGMSASSYESIACRRKLRHAEGRGGVRCAAS